MAQAQTQLAIPGVLLFDWHGTLVDTLDAMYAAMEDMLPQLEQLGLLERLLPEPRCKNPHDARLVRYIRTFRHLHPRILAERRVSRTDIFNAIFGSDRQAKRVAHEAYNRCYRAHYSDVRPFQDGVYEYLSLFRRLGIRLGVATNRNREFLEHELATVDGGRWQDLFAVTVCADDVAHYKPAPDVILAALAALDVPADGGVWYVGDSYTDMVAAAGAGVGAVFYNGHHYEPDWFKRSFIGGKHAPQAVVDSFEALVERIAILQDAQPAAYPLSLRAIRPPAYPPPSPPPPRVVPNWHPAVARLSAPRVILFDWHATLVDTMDAMYQAVDATLAELAELGLAERLVAVEAGRCGDDVALISYVREHAALPPIIKRERRVSRTDLFETLFGDDLEAKQLAHRRFSGHYRKYFGVVRPFEPQLGSLLAAVRALPMQLGVITNRDREFFEHEIGALDEDWTELFDTYVCGDDTVKRKPYPDPLYKALDNLGQPAGPQVWYVGDSASDTVAAHRAGVTSVFFNGAEWDLLWLRQRFAGTEEYPYRPDVVVNDFAEFWALVLACWQRQEDAVEPPLPA